MGAHNFSPYCRPYGVCNEFEGKTQDGVNVRTIQEICTSVARSSSDADNGRRSFAATSYCTGHRHQDNNRKPKKNLQTFQGIAYVNNINTLRNILNDEIEDRRKNAYYNGLKIENLNLGQVKDTPIISNLKQEGEYIETTYPNAIADKIKYLKSFCDNIKAKTKDSKNLESSIGTISNISSDIKSGKIVLGGSPEKIQNVIAKAVTDCICYSDCHGFSVCECYGYCNCNY